MYNICIYALNNHTQTKSIHQSIQFISKIYRHGCDRLKKCDARSYTTSKRSITGPINYKIAMSEPIKNEKAAHAPLFRNKYRSRKLDTHHDQKCHFHCRGGVGWGASMKDTNCLAEGPHTHTKIHLGDGFSTYSEDGRGKKCLRNSKVGVRTDESGEGKGKRGGSAGPRERSLKGGLGGEEERQRERT